MSASNGSTVSVPEPTAPKPAPKKHDRESYRPKVDRDRVHKTVASSLTEVVHEAIRQAIDYVTLARFYDQDKPTSVRYGHLVDATESIEIAMTYLAMARHELAHRMQTEHIDGSDTSDTSDTVTDW